MKLYIYIKIIIDILFTNQFSNYGEYNVKFLVLILYFLKIFFFKLDINQINTLINFH